MADYVFTLRNVRKAHGDKVVLDNVTLSFLHGAKIGVVGPNGTGKSSLLKIMAGLEHANNGDAILDPGATVGMLQQEPPLTEGKTVLENVEEAVAEIKAKLDRFNKISEELGDPDADYDKLLAEMGDLQTDLDHANAWDLDSRLDQAMDALRCPPARRRWSTTSPVASAAGSRCASCCSSSPTCCCSTSPPTTSTPSRCSGSRATSRPTPAAVLAITHDRYFLDNVAAVDPRARPRQDAPLRGQLLDVPRDQEGPPQDRGAEGRQARQDAGEGARVGPLQRQGPPDQEPLASRALRGDGRRGRPDAQDRHLRDQHPRRAAAG